MQLSVLYTMYFQGLESGSKADDKNQNTKVKSIPNPNKVSYKWNRKKVNLNWLQLGLYNYKIQKKHIVCESLQRFFCGRDGSFWASE